jgi:ATP-binding cassette, subfamily B, bacterial PglK
MRDLKLLYSMLSAPQRTKLPFVLMMAAITAVVEAAALLSIVLLISVLTNVQPTGLTRIIQDLLAPDEASVMSVAILVLCVFIGKNLYAFFNELVQNRYIGSVRHFLSTSLLTTILRQPYAFFLNKNTNELSARFLTDVDRVSDGYVRPMLLAATEIMVATGILAVLAIQRPTETAFLVIGVVIFGGLLQVVLGRATRSASQDFTRHQHRRYHLGGTVMQGVKEVKSACKELFFLEKFRGVSLDLTAIQIRQAMVAVSPRMILESAAFIVLVSSLWLIQSREGGLERYFPVIALYVTAAYRLLPSVSRIMSSLQQLRYAHEPIAGIRALLDESSSEEPGTDETTGVKFDHSFGLDHVTFTYPGAKIPSLCSVHLSIKKNEFVGIVGQSGAGKSTLVDVLLSLLQPSEGSLVVDGKPLPADKIRQWRAGIGYVAQDVFLTDGTLTENIAFGFGDAIDMDQILRAAEMAGVDQFVRGLPEGYETLAGQNGVRLSGGQRQRIGIARALFRGVDILLFDEATSALDHETERMIAESIQSLSGKVTIVVVAHRLSTVASADRVIMIERGAVIAEGSLEDLERHGLVNPTLRRPAALQNAPVD